MTDEDVPALTSLVHAAYAEHGARGLNFTAVDQSEETTRRRALTGASRVCESQGAIHWPGKTYDSVVMTRELADVQGASIFTSCDASIDACERP